MIHRLIAALLIATGVTGCGSVRTLSSDNVAKVDDLHLKGTYCGDTIPRVYGGVVYNLCVMNGGSGERGGSGYRYMPALVPYSVIDMGLSAVADTLTLPYTLYRQNRDGDIQLVRD
ncbi:YceK/YidQ family lipoprotein [Pseudomonas sp. SCB32]|uniref:YceK/YidQ family lipoprotein n=1 Tax=Pseudomonas sp. SCB32 TaxID=2653853 RepID=UPI0012647EC7|nr:YceK/YidQ family lipoprotein [Pseudomonas sp. SCB32]